MIDLDSALTLVSRVLVIPRIADDLISASSRQNAHEAVVDGDVRRSLYLAIREDEAAERRAGQRVQTAL